ncbi:hypothetical protein BKA70DRAFT_1113253 [Coprinopsis sp. MPI-PUGE-AT-0042]|nr:hypothetical protein BKA70DRAFT_1113253 [Coprinopsis sp. MPI-PUGE-AT-0042]
MTTPLRQQTTPSLPPGPRYAYQVGRYTQQLFQCLLNPAHPKPQHPQLSFDVRTECQQIADIVYAAGMNQTPLSWSIMDYEEAIREIPKSQRPSLDKRFPPLPGLRPDGSLKLISTPTVFQDDNGVIVWWYLPGIIQTKRQVMSSLSIFL